MRPVDFKVKVKMDKPEEKIGSIYIPDSVQDSHQIEQDMGEIIDMGGRACADFGEPVPEIGDRVMVSRHAGFIMYEGSGKDKVMYKIINDKDITMVESD